MRKEIQLHSFDQKKFSSALERRLEEVFPVAVEPKGTAKNKFTKTKNTPLFKLKKILLSMEWEVEDSTLTDYLDEIKNLQKQYRNDVYCFNMLKLQFLYGKYIQYYKYKLPLNTYKRIYSLYVNTSRILKDEDLSPKKKKNIVVAEIKKFKEFKKYFSSSQIYGTPQNSSLHMYRRKIITSDKPPNKPIGSDLNNDNQVFDQYVSKIVLELKDFFKKELSEIKSELYKWQNRQLDDQKTTSQ